MDSKNIKFSFLVFCLLSLIFLGIRANAQGASLYFSSSGDSFGAGENFSVDIKINTGGEPINALYTHINFPADKLRIVSVSKEDSIFTLWPDEPSFSNENGDLYFSGGVPHPGFTGTNGQILRIQFEAREEGKAELIFKESQVLADDGQGTDIFLRGFNETYILKPPVPQILSSTNPDQNKWYRKNTVEIHWNLEQNVTKASFILDENPETWPDEIPEGRIDSYTYKNIEDGIWFFHLRVNTEKGWSNPRHYRVLIDTLPPDSFDIVVDNGGDPTNPQPVLYFETEDLLSGVDYYVVKIGEGADIFTEILPHNPFQMPLQKPGTHPVLVQAVDKAENSRDSSAKVEVKPIKQPEISVWPQKFIAGEEILYLEGKALPEVEVKIFLIKNGETLKEWQAKSDKQGEWFFSSKEILKSGFYQLSVMAQDDRGAISRLSEGKTMEVDFSGFELGFLMVTFRSLAMALFIIFGSGIIFIGFNFYKSCQLKRSLSKEVREVKESLYQAFANLRKETERKIEMIDLQPGFNRQERAIYDDLLIAIKTAQESIEKEIAHIANYLK